jgi:uncharacterized protein YjcR
MIRAYLKKHPDADLTTMAKDLKHTSPMALRGRLYQIGVRLKIRKDAVSGPAKRIDRENVRALLMKGIKYQLIAGEVGCSPSTVAEIASKEFNLRLRMKRVSQDELRAYLKKHPDADLATMAKALGFKSVVGLRRRLDSMGIKIEIRKCATLGARETIDRNKLSEKEGVAA